jgi:hypothetical protein
MIVVVPLGTPTVAGNSGSGLQSDSYRVPDLIGMAWRYSGSRIEPLGPKL